jgi:hypothetical protein
VTWLESLNRNSRPNRGWPARMKSEWRANSRPFTNKDTTPA